MIEIDGAIEGWRCSVWHEGIQVDKKDRRQFRAVVNSFDMFFLLVVGLSFIFQEIKIIPLFSQKQIQPELILLLVTVLVVVVKTMRDTTALTETSWCGWSGRFAVFRSSSYGRGKSHQSDGSRSDATLNRPFEKHDHICVDPEYRRDATTMNRVFLSGSIWTDACRKVPSHEQWINITSRRSKNRLEQREKDGQSRWINEENWRIDALLSVGLTSSSRKIWSIKSAVSPDR